MTFQSWADVYDERAKQLSDPLEICEFFVGQKTCPAEWFEAVVKLIVNALDLQPADRVLEVGCGCGVLMRHLQGLAAELVGVDPARHPLAIASQQVPNASFLKASAAELPFGDGYFDKAFSYQVFHYLGDLETARQAVLELRRVVKRGGRILIGQVPDAARYDAYQIRRAQRGFQRQRIVDHELSWLWYPADFFLEFQDQFQTVEIDRQPHDLDPAYEFRYDVRIVV